MLGALKAEANKKQEVSRLLQYANETDKIVPAPEERHKLAQTLNLFATRFEEENAVDSWKASVLAHTRQLSEYEIAFVRELYPNKIVSTENLVDKETLTLKQLESLSIYEEVKVECGNILRSFIELSSEINPSTMDLYVVPNDKEKTYLQLVMDVLTGTDDIFENFETLISVFKDNKEELENIRISIIEPVLNKIVRTASFFEYSISEANFERVIFNERTGFYLNKDAIEKHNNQVLEFAFEKYKDRDAHEGTSVFREYYIMLLNRHQEMKLKSLQVENHEGNFDLVEDYEDLSQKLLSRLPKPGAKAEKLEEGFFKRIMNSWL